MTGTSIRLSVDPETPVQGGTFRVTYSWLYVDDDVNEITVWIWADPATNQEYSFTMTRPTNGSATTTSGDLSVPADATGLKITADYATPLSVTVSKEE